MHKRRAHAAFTWVAVAACLSLMATPVAAQRGADKEMTSPLGSYLAGRVARAQNDTAAAVQFYRRALTTAPQTPEILERAFLVEAAEGNADTAVALARKLVMLQPQHRLGRAWLGIAAYKRGQFKRADEHFAQSSSGLIGELTGALARAWIAQRRGQKKTALSRLTNSQRAEWVQYYLRYHRALIADLQKNTTLARQNYSQIFKSDARMPRVTISYIHHATKTGQFALAKDILARNEEATAGPVHPAVANIAAAVRANRRLPLLIASADDGLAEVFYGLGEALTTEGGVQLGAMYLRMALFVKPDFPFAQGALANVYETTKHYLRANALYDKIPTSSPLQLLIAIRKANNLDALDRTNEAVEVLAKLADRHPEDIRPVEALAGLLRGRERFKEAIPHYDKLIAMVGTPEASHWRYWYARGTSYERIKDWQQGERDLLRANELNPDQALVLNYLGYSWVDQNTNLQQGLKFIEKAVQLKPDDGYIVDSLGWAHYRLENYEKAVGHLERAVELRPADPILNDHLGDALWRVGRIREARFQWEQSLTLEPEKDHALKTREKLAKGLPPLTNTIKATTPAKHTLGKRVEATADKTKR